MELLGETDPNESESDIVRHATREFKEMKWGKKMPLFMLDSQGYCVGNLRERRNTFTYGIPNVTLPPHEKMGVHINYLCDSVGSR